MKKLLYLTLALAAFSPPAFSQTIPLALGLSQNANLNANTNTNNNLNANVNRNLSTSRATASSNLRNNVTNSNNLANTNDLHNSNTNNVTVGGQENYQGTYFGGTTEAASSAGTALAASGPCIGDSYSAGVQALVVGVSASYISESAKCNRRELLRLMMGSPDPQIRQLSSVGLQRMYAEEFGNGGQTQTVASASPYKPAPAPAPVAPVTSANPPIAGGKPAYCITASHGSAIWQSNCQ